LVKRHPASDGPLACGDSIEVAMLRWIQDEEITMKAIVQDRYGGPEALELAEIDRPPLGDHDALVRVHAASIHFGDQMIMRGKPKLFRPIYGFGKPRNRVPGLDIAGTVEAVGTGVARFGPGEEVFGTCTGALAEYVSTPEDKLERKPSNLTFEQAAAVPTSGLAALHGIRDAGKVQPGQKVLIEDPGHTSTRCELLESHCVPLARPDRPDWSRGPYANRSVGRQGLDRHRE
jgi:D-arabinose 1-dehydrogenase-like Zn-dependent alcohol dehydrogenase